MTTRSGPPARGPACRSAAYRGLFLVCLAACSGDAFEIGESATSGDANRGGSTRPAPEEEERCDDRAELRLHDSACWPTQHVGRWRGFATTSPYYQHRLARNFEYPSELLLEVSEQGVATLTFSSGSTRPARSGDAGADGAAGDAGSAGDAGVVEAGADDTGARLDAGVRVGPPALGLVLGFPYPLRELSMSGGPTAARQADPLLDFSLLIAEPWSDFCAAWPAQPDPYPELEPCVCRSDDEGPPRSCAPAPEVLSVTLALSADAQALRGSARSLAQDGVIVAGWEFVRE